VVEIEEPKLVAQLMAGRFGSVRFVS